MPIRKPVFDPPFNVIRASHVELAVRDVIHGREVRNREALANPEALDQFRDLPELID